LPAKAFGRKRRKKHKILPMQKWTAPMALTQTPGWRNTEVYEYNTLFFTISELLRTLTGNRWI